MLFCNIYCKNTANICLFLLVMPCLREFYKGFSRRVLSHKSHIIVQKYVRVERSSRLRIEMICDGLFLLLWMCDTCNTLMDFQLTVCCKISGRTLAVCLDETNAAIPNSNVQLSHLPSGVKLVHFVALSILFYLTVQLYRFYFIHTC